MINMTALEDHAGDITRKARQAAGVNTAEAAKAAGISEDEYAKWEQNGSSPAEIDFPSLCSLLELNPAKFQTILDGWLPIKRDLAQWRFLEIITTARHGNAANCYIIRDETTGAGALFDTGWEPSSVIDIIRTNNVEPLYLFITHLHHDHVSGLDMLKKEFTKMHVQDAGSTGTNPFSVGALNVTPVRTPGHSSDGMSYVVSGFPGGAPAAAIVGDSLFAGSIGNGFFSFNTLICNVREKILSLPGDTLICPGHGPLTTVTEELEHNPFF
ncbi:MAG: MBL fold metallo-hydrolase [Verrucomicrobia bacterium]|nr:MBL fold metallo-hydrolase [Verrucomicrobiota bacterium]MCF7708545.1 MBL fold metallo-hydrolase [Verrucomicrobiota bacterium]